LHEGTAAAKELLPHILSTRAGLRFLELVTFDDVRTDWLIFDPESGQPCELWLLVARDQATAMVLGFVMHPARARDDGSDSHLGQREMKQLAAWLLERYPLPLDYISTWKVERGTATLSQGSAQALQGVAAGPHQGFLHVDARRPIARWSQGKSQGELPRQSFARIP
jgi:hypothetical protein